MDEITILAAVGSFLLGSGCGVLISHAYRAPEVIEVVVPVDAVTVEDDSPLHVHEATHATPSGWYCDCGVHRHVYVFGAEEPKRCQCGAVGTGKEWARD